jgi:hypothetical protein
MQCYRILSLIHKWIQKLVFDGVSLATNFWSSLAPCYSAMGARSRHKNLCRFLVTNQLLNPFVYIFLFLFSQINAVEVEEITYEWLIDFGNTTSYTEHIPHFNQLFKTMKVRWMLECGCGFATKYFLDHCEKVISVEFLNPGTDDSWFKVCLKLFTDYTNWLPITYNYDHSDESFNRACGYQCSQHQDYALIDPTYLFSLSKFFKSQQKAASKKSSYIDVAFVDPGVYIRGDLVKVLLELKVPVVIAHDTASETLATSEDDLYGWTKVATPEDYEKIYIPSGQGTTFWISKTLPHVIDSFLAYRRTIIEANGKKTISAEF